jgi:pilus assembly protein Flp/PilA
MLTLSVSSWLRYLRTRLSPYWREPSPGQGLVEYALILIFVAVVMVLVLTILAPGITNIYSNIVQTLNDGVGN